MSAVPGVPGRHRESKARASHGTARMERRRLRPATVRCRRTQSPPRLARAPQEHPPQVRRRLNWPVVLTGRMHLADDQRPASVTSETFAVRLASKRVVSFNGEVFGLPHNLHRVDGGRLDTSIFRLARDHRGEAPNRGNAHSKGACGYDSCSHVGAPFKTNMSASVRFHSCLPVTKNFE